MRLLPFRRKKEQDPIDEVQEARERALAYMRQRRGMANDDERPEAPTAQEWPEERVLDPAEAERVMAEQSEAEATEAAPEATAEETTVPDFLRKTEEGEEAPQASEEPAPEPQAEDPAPAADGALSGLGDEGGDDLMNLFQDAKEEAGDKSLANEVEDLSMDSLLNEIETIRQGLGVKPRGPNVRTIKLSDPEEEEADEPEDAPEEEPIKAEQIDLTPPEGAEPPEIPAPALESEGDAEAEAEAGPDDEVFVELIHGHPAEPPKPVVNNAAPPSEHRGSRMAPPEESQSQSGGGAKGPVLHLLFLALLLGGAIFSYTKVELPSGTANAVAAPSQTPAVLAVFRSPSATATPIPRRTKPPTPTVSPTPSPTPSPSPTPEPTPRVRDASIPYPFYTYDVEYGDDLMSIAIDHGVCPDYLLWNNDRDEDTPLYAGDEMLIPDVPGIIYTVESGDTLEWIALQFSSTVAAITGVPGNQVQSNTDLLVGDQLLIPGGIPQSALELSDEERWATTVPSDYGYVWPYWGPITTYFGEVRENGYVHNAIDIGGLGHYGMSVVSIAGGTVIFVGEDAEFGQHVIVEHDDGSRSVYAHLSWFYVSEGARVEQSQAIGGLGCTGASTGTHLHFELWRDGVPVDPLLYLN